MMYLAMTDRLWVRWTSQIHEEWMRNVQRDYAGMTRDRVSGSGTSWTSTPRTPS